MAGTNISEIVPLIATSGSKSDTSPVSSNKTYVEMPSAPMLSMDSANELRNQYAVLVSSDNYGYLDKKKISALINAALDSPYKPKPAEVVPSTPSVKGDFNLLDIGQKSGVGVRAPENLVGKAPVLTDEEISNIKMDIKEPAKAPEDTGMSSTLRAGLSVGTFALKAIEQNLVDDSLNKYNAELKARVEEGKYWFDPATDVQPDLEAYLDSLPSMTDVYKDSTFTQGVMTDDGDFDAGDFTKILDPVGQVIERGLTGGDPDSEYNGMAEYVFQKAGERGLEGYTSIGSPFGLLFGLVGVVEGILSWNSAVEQDREIKNEARKAYEKSLYEWSKQRQALINSTGTALASISADAERRRQAGVAAKEAEELKEQVTAKTQMVNLINFLNDQRGKAPAQQPAYMAL